MSSKRQVKLSRLAPRRQDNIDVVVGRHQHSSTSSGSSSASASYVRQNSFASRFDARAHFDPYEVYDECYDNYDTTASNYSAAHAAAADDHDADVWFNTDALFHVSRYAFPPPWPTLAVDKVADRRTHARY